MFFFLFITDNKKFFLEKTCQEQVNDINFETDPKTKTDPIPITSNFTSNKFNTKCQKLIEINKKNSFLFIFL